MGSSKKTNKKVTKKAQVKKSEPVIVSAPTISLVDAADQTNSDGGDSEKTNDHPLDLKVDSGLNLRSNEAPGKVKPEKVTLKAARPGRSLRKFRKFK